MGFSRWPLDRSSVTGPYSAKCGPSRLVAGIGHPSRLRFGPLAGARPGGGRLVALDTPMPKNRPHRTRYSAFSCLGWCLALSEAL